MTNNTGVRLPGFTGAVSLGPCLQTYSSTASHQAGQEQIILEANGCPGPLVRGEAIREGPTEAIALSLARTAAFEDFLRRCPPPCVINVPFGFQQGIQSGCGMRFGFSPNPWVCRARFTGLCLPERPAEPVPELAPAPEVVIPPVTLPEQPLATVPVPVPETSPVIVPVPTNGTPVPAPTNGVSDTILNVLKTVGVIVLGVIVIAGTIVILVKALPLIAGAGLVKAAAAAAGVTIVVVGEEE